MVKNNLKVLCVLYDDPVDGFPPKYAREDVPKIPIIKKDTTPIPTSVRYYHNWVIKYIYDPSD